MPNPKPYVVDSVSDVEGLVEEGPGKTTNLNKLVIIGCICVCALGLITWGAVEIAMQGEEPQPRPTLPTIPGESPSPTPGEPGEIKYRAGRGIADVTGLAADGALYGYANPAQDARGIHMRQFSRAFIMEYKSTGKRVVFVSIDVAMVSEALHKSVMEKLLVEFDDGKYTEDNVMLSCTHSHATPGGYHTYWMYAAPTLGFIEETFNVLLEGVVQSILDADADLQDARLFTNSKEVPPGGSINRSLWSYLHNPEEEREMYEHDVDRDLIIMKMEAEDGTPMGVISLFGVHATSMPANQHLVSPDNFGYGAQAFERYMEPDTMPGKTRFVAGFSPASEGDVSPRSEGQFCDFENRIECRLNTSTCPPNYNLASQCHGYGPGVDMYDDTRIAGNYQFEAAREAFETATHELTGEADYRFQFINISNIDMGMDGDRPKKTCAPAMGYSMGAGATDGPGGLYQGITEGIPAVDFVVTLLGATEEMRECQQPKPVLLPSGTANFGWYWQPFVVPIQILRIGDLVIIGVPHETTTMAGRRIKRVVKQALEDNGAPSTLVPVVVSMANLYASYLTTYEEYVIQRYEAASTPYGPYTLDAYLLKFGEMAEAMAKDEPVPRGPSPPDMRGLSRDALPPHRTDDPLNGHSFGQVLEDANLQYQQGESAVVKFVSASPRNDHKEKTGGTYLEVQKEVGSDWVTVYTDAHFETKYYWDSSCHNVLSGPVIRILGCGLNIPELSDLLPEDVTLPINIPPIPGLRSGSQQSNATIVWDIPLDQEPGRYRIKHTGKYHENPIFGDPTLTPYEGISREFTVVQGTGQVRRYQHPTAVTEAPPKTGNIFRDELGAWWDQTGVEAPIIDYETLQVKSP